MRALRLKQRLDYWGQIRGKRVRPGEWLYAKVINGIEQGFTSAIGRDPEVARKLGIRGMAIVGVRKQIRCGTWPLQNRGFKPKRLLSKGPRSSNVLGVL